MVLSGFARLDENKIVSNHCSTSVFLANCVHSGEVFFDQLIVQGFLVQIFRMLAMGPNEGQAEGIQLASVPWTIFVPTAAWT